MTTKNKDNMLVRIKEAEHMLSICETPTDAADIADVAEAARVYAKRSGAAIPVINHAVRIKLNAERKAGELLAGMSMNSTAKLESNPTRLSDMGIKKHQSSKWQKFATVPQELSTEKLNAKKDTVELHSKDLFKLAKSQAPKEGIIKPDNHTANFSDFSEIVKMGVKFGTVYADPPWRYSNQGTRGSTDDHYDGTMSVDEICAMPIGEITEDKSHLHLWTTNAFLFETQKILEAWGFEYKSTFVWVKPQMGMGNYWRNSHELMITGVKGGLTADSKAEMSWVECRRGRHSSKPQQVRESIMRLSPGPYLELFGRREIQDWVVFGNQIEKELL
jgi:N6-adenosine-specific RNA methylase IME4